MKKAVSILAALVAFEHIGILVLEMFLWTHEIGMKVFKTTLEQAQMSKVLAMNQGLYNGFLAAGLIWSFFIKDSTFQNSTRIFFFGCVAVAAIFGGLTAKFSIIFTQGTPAYIGLLAAILYHKKIQK